MFVSPSWLLSHSPQALFCTCPICPLAGFHLGRRRRFLLHFHISLAAFGFALDTGGPVQDLRWALQDVHIADAQLGPAAASVADVDFSDDRF